MLHINHYFFNATKKIDKLSQYCNKHLMCVLCNIDFAIKHCDSASDETINPRLCIDPERVVN